MASRLYVVRHGQTESSQRMAYSGRSDIALTEQGREQARAAAAQLVDADIDAVVSSPLIRARDTAQAIADAASAPVRVDERLTEVDYGDFEGLDREAASARFGQAFDDWRADPFGAPVPGMEPLGDALARARAATADAIDRHTTPVLVGHQGILRIVLIVLGELAPEDYFTLRLHEAQPLLVEAPKIVGA